MILSFISMRNNKKVQCTKIIIGRIEIECLTLIAIHELSRIKVIVFYDYLF